MDATATPSVAQPIFRDLTCGQCGYLRTGLPSGALCPECGSPPPVIITPLVARAGMAQSRAQQAWLATLTVGLLLLIVSSYFALQSELFINSGGLSLVIINAPAPKLTAGGCLLREMGNPAEWGVQGFLATLGTLLAVWLITEPQVSRVDEMLFSLRRCVRGVAVLTFGGLFGTLLSGYEINNYDWSWYTLPSLMTSVGVVELPTNTLLYLYLARLSRRFDPSTEPRAQFGLNIAVWLVAVTCGSGVILSALRASAQDEPVVMWRWVQMFYGVLAVASGAIMTVGVLRLTLRMLAATLDASMLSLPQALRKLAAPLNRLIAAVRAEPTRFAAVTGVILWMSFTRPLLTLTAGLEHRRGLGGDLPALNFIGPKISAVALLEVSTYSRVEVRLAVLMTLAALWLITIHRPTIAWPRANWVRWGPTLALGAGVGIVLTIEQAVTPLRQSYWNAAAVVLIEAPATLLVYLYSANLAAAVGSAVLARQLRVVGSLASLVILLPMPLMVFSETLNHRGQPKFMLVVGAAYGMMVIAASVAAWAVLVRLTWALISGSRPATYRSADATPQAANARANSGVGSE